MKTEDVIKHFRSRKIELPAKKNLYKVECNGKVLRSSDEILTAEVEYFSKLYSEYDSCVGSTYLDELNFENKLNENQREECDNVITLNECWKVLSSVKTGKSPGPDGLTYEFYKTFWAHLKHILLKNFNYSLAVGNLSVSQSRAVITLIHKKGRKELLSNWRPISLLNTDYKILASVLANRLKSVLSSCISSDQNAYLKGRFISNNIRLIDDVISHMHKHKKSGAILFLDLEKAFDKVNRDFLYRVLEKFNFGSQFINYIKTLYNNAQSCIMNNNWQSIYFPLKRGLRQGCPVSALLFLLVIEILAIDLKQNQDINGIDIGIDITSELKISQFADDTTLFTANETSLRRALTRIKIFSGEAGPSLNISKTKGFGFGTFDFNQFKSIDWTCEFVKTLGVYFSKNMNDAYEKTWRDKIEQIENHLKQWRCRNLTYFGKVTVLKSLVLSNITYVMSVFPTIESVNKKINQLIFNFLWNGRDRVKRKTVIGHTESGGINMPDFVLQSKALKAVWLQRLLEEDQSDKYLARWKIIPLQYINSFGVNGLVLKMPFENECEFKQLYNLPAFYRQCIIAWKNCKNILSSCHQVETIDEIRQQLLWGNSHIKHKGASFFWKHWVLSKILVVGDIVSEDGSLDMNCIRVKLRKKGNYLCESKLIWSCIPKSWKGVLQREVIVSHNLSGSHFIDQTNQPVLTVMPQTNIKGKASKFLYKLLVNKSFITPNVEEYWNLFFGADIKWTMI